MYTLIRDKGVAAPVDVLMAVGVLSKTDYKVWSILDEYPIFTPDGYRPQIKSILKNDFGAQISQKTITLSKVMV